MFDETFNSVYKKFKMQFYHKVFRKWGAKEESLTTVETFCMEVIHSLGRVTVGEFARFTNNSSANAADKVNNLIKKGYLRKIQSEEDKRKYYLEPTDKYLNYYNIGARYQNDILNRVIGQCTSEELEVVERVLHVLERELDKDLSEFEFQKKK